MIISFFFIFQIFQIHCFQFKMYLLAWAINQSFFGRYGFEQHVITENGFERLRKKIKIDYM